MDDIDATQAAHLVHPLGHVVPVQMNIVPCPPSKKPRIYELGRPIAVPSTLSQLHLHLAQPTIPSDHGHLPRPPPPPGAPPDERQQPSSPSDQPLQPPQLGLGLANPNQRVPTAPVALPSPALLTNALTGHPFSVAQPPGMAHSSVPLGTVNVPNGLMTLGAPMTEGHQFDLRLDHIWKMTDEIKASLAAKGIIVQTGRWTATEKKTLVANAQHFADIRGLRISDIVNPKTNVGPPAELRSELFRAACKGISRPVQAIQKQLRRMFPADEQQKRGPFTPQESALLAELYKVHCKNWKEIAQKMNRNTNSVRDHYRFVISRREACGTQLHMQWTKEEEDKLAELVYQSLGVPPGSDVTGGVKWEMIASKMQFRTALQCSQKWYRTLNPRLKNGGGESQWGKGRAWTPQQSALLLDVLEQSGARDESEISWQKISADLTEQGRHLQFKAHSNSSLYQHWLYLKRRLEVGNCRASVALRSMPLKDHIQQVRSIIIDKAVMGRKKRSNAEAKLRSAVSDTAPVAPVAPVTPAHMIHAQLMPREGVPPGMSMQRAPLPPGPPHVPESTYVAVAPRVPMHPSMLAALGPTVGHPHAMLPPPASANTPQQQHSHQPNELPPPPSV